MTTTMKTMKTMRRILCDLRPRWRAVLAAVLASALGVGTGVTLALWKTSVNAGPVGPLRAVAGFAVTRGGVTDVAASSAATVGFAITREDAAALVASPDQVIAIPFDVAALVSGTDGVDYQVAVGNPEPGSLLAGAQIFVFPLVPEEPGPPGDGGDDGDDIGGPPEVECAPGSLTDSVLDELTAISSSTTLRPATAVTIHWCAVLRYDADRYTNVATVTGTTIDEQLMTGQTAWQVRLVPDPTLQADVPVTLTHTITAP